MSNGRALVMVMEENRRHVVIGCALSQELKSLITLIAVRYEHSAAATEKSPHVIQIAVVHFGHGAGHPKQTAGRQICRSTQGSAEKPGRHGTFDNDRGATTTKDIE